VLSNPGHFSGIRYLDLTSIPLRDDDVKHIAFMVHLETLHLGETGIGTDALCMLSLLKNCLALLHLQDNSKIDDDAIPTFAVLHKLRFLKIEGTSITMHGIRKLAKRLDKDQRVMGISLPLACEDYLADLSTHYCIHPDPPLITSAEAVPSLSVIALKANLSAHHAINDGILPTGTKAEMVQRLIDILEIRAGDLLLGKVFGLHDDRASDEDCSQLESAGEDDSDITEVESRDILSASS
ncbi:hypothetical protein CALVIDRAFT_488609, partial [Calocera viscosa TUFC12733]